jgi:GT2 family glycosyltransferase
VAKIDVLIPDQGHDPVPTLAGLAAQSGPRLRIVLSARPGPACGVFRLLSHHGHEVVPVRHPRGQGPAERLMHLLNRARAEHVLLLDDDVWLEPGTLQMLYRAIRTLRCGFVGYAPQRLSHLDDQSLAGAAAYDEWAGRPMPEHVEPGSPAWSRHCLHRGATLIHLANELNLRPDEWRAYKIAWIDGCVLYDRAALLRCGAFSPSDPLPAEHAQLRVMARHGAAGILPSGAVRLEPVLT